MIVPCTTCEFQNDLTELGVGAGHVLDCGGCGIQLRVVVFGDAPVGIDEVELHNVQPEYNVEPLRIRWEGGVEENGN